MPGSCQGGANIVCTKSHCSSSLHLLFRKRTWSEMCVGPWMLFDALVSGQVKRMFYNAQGALFQERSELHLLTSGVLQA